jgi:hypothetical protein
MGVVAALDVGVVTALVVGGLTTGAGAWIGGVSGGSWRFMRQHEPKPLPMLEQPLPKHDAANTSAAKTPFLPKNAPSFIGLPPVSSQHEEKRIGPQMGKMEKMFKIQFDSFIFFIFPICG